MPRRSPANRRKTAVKLDPVQLARLLKQRKATGVLIAIGIIIALALLDQQAGLLPVDDDWHRYHGQTFEVVRVVDGDTLHLRISDGDRPTTRVRLWGVDTPEMHTNDPNRPPDPWAQEATDFTRQTLADQPVTLYLQRHRLRGRYNRILAYAQLPDGRDLSAELINAGLSKHDDRWGHDRAQTYDNLQQRARNAQQGLWSGENSP